MSSALQAGDLVCVTGANGFIASHLIRDLLQAGYRVRGTVRDPSNVEKTAHLFAMAAEAEAAQAAPAATYMTAAEATAAAASNAVAFCIYMHNILVRDGSVVSGTATTNGNFQDVKNDF